MTVFVTGTDTGCGKTYISGLLIRAAIFSGYSACGMKPVATGSQQGENEDVAKLLEASSVEMPLKDRAVYSFEPPCSPHIASSQAGKIISFPKIEEAYKKWHWNKSDTEDNVMNQIMEKADSNISKAYVVMGSYTYNGQYLPLKVSAGIGLKFKKD